MTKRQEHSNGWACSDCLQLLANGETPPEMDEDETAAYLARISDADSITLGRMIGEDGCNCEDWDTDDHRDGCERQEFSMGYCDVCGSTLGGSRDAVTFWFDAEEAPADEVSYSASVAIRARYLGPTNYRGSRFRVWRADGTWAEDPDRLEVPFDHGLSHSDRARDLIARYLEHKPDGWHGAWTVTGAGDSEYLAVKAPQR